jgi:hypothetical protein
MASASRTEGSGEHLRDGMPSHRRIWLSAHRQATTHDGHAPAAIVSDSKTRPSASRHREFSHRPGVSTDGQTALFTATISVTWAIHRRKLSIAAPAVHSATYYLRSSAFIIFPYLR